MIVIKVELWPHGRGGAAIREIGRMVIFNDGTANDPHNRRGNYGVKLMRRGTADKVQKEGAVEPGSSIALFEQFETLRTASVHDYARLAYPVWTLIGRAIKNLGLKGTGE